MKIILPLAALTLALTLSSCAGTARRSPASEPPDTQSIELATKLKGGSMKFRAFREGNQASVLGFLDVKFRDCEAKVAADNTGHKFDVDYKGSWVECNVDVESDPMKARIKAAVVGDKRKFTVVLYAEEPNHYNLDARLNLEWRDKKWNGKGKVTGWLNQRISSGTNLTVTVRESLDF